MHYTELLHSPVLAKLSSGSQNIVNTGPKTEDETGALTRTHINRGADKVD